MKNLLLLSCLFVTGLAFSQCGTYQINTYQSDNYVTTANPGTTVSSQNIMVLNNLNVTYQWYKGYNTVITNGANYSGTNTSQLTVYNLSYSTAGQYRCLVTNVDGCNDTASFKINICENINLQPNNITTSTNSNVTFTVNHPNPFATYQWKTDFGTGFQNVTNAGQYSGANTNTLVVSNVNINNNNQYFRCVVNPIVCSTLLNSDTVVLLVNSTSSISENENSKYSVSPNPVTNSFSINGIESLDNITSIQLKDMHGKIVKELVPDNMTFEIQDLKSGVYLVEIFTNDSTEIIRIVKQ